MVGGWVVLSGNITTSWLHIASWNLPDSQLCWESKMEPSVAIFGWADKRVKHTEGGEDEPHGDAEGGSHVPPTLCWGQRVHGNAKQGHQHLCQDQVHQEQVEVCPKLEKMQLLKSTIEAMVSFNLKIFLTPNFLPVRIWIFFIDLFIFEIRYILTGQNLELTQPRIDTP